MTRTQVKQHIHQGPIPDPATLSGYNQIVPNAAERIISMAEVEAKHRQILEEKTLDANIHDRKSARFEIRLGQSFAFLLCVVIVGCGSYVAVSGAPWPGIILSSTGLSGIILAYLKK